MEYQKIEEILDYLRSHFGHNSECSYSRIDGGKPEIIRYDEHTAISLWDCGAIICDKDQLFFIDQDDGNWYCSTYRHIEDGYFTFYGLLDPMSIGWIDSFTSALKHLQEYVNTNGTPVYYKHLKEPTIAHYTL